jgi:hypothetical protein
MTIQEKTTKVNELKAAFHSNIAKIDELTKKATLVQKCDLIKARIDLIQIYSAEVSRICHG